jgi:hypothetical protein
MSDEEVYQKLFTSSSDPRDTLNIIQTITAISATEDMLRKVYLLRLIFAVIVRISFVASVWLFMFRIDLWYGVLIFAVLSLIAGGVSDHELPKQNER